MNMTRSHPQQSPVASATSRDPIANRPQNIHRATSSPQSSGALAQAFGSRVLRYGLALVILWIGMMKFTNYEAVGIQPLVATSPLMGWIYSALSVQQFSTSLGVVEIAIALLIGLRPWFPWASAIGSAGAVFMFVTTLSFLFSAPGWESSLGGFPALSASVGQFLIKDLVLLGAAIWTYGEAFSAAQMNA